MKPAAASPRVAPVFYHGRAARVNRADHAGRQVVRIMAMLPVIPEGRPYVAVPWRKTEKSKSKFWRNRLTPAGVYLYNIFMLIILRKWGNGASRAFAGGGEAGLRRPRFRAADGQACVAMERRGPPAIPSRSCGNAPAAAGPGSARLCGRFAGRGKPLNRTAPEIDFCLPFHEIQCIISMVKYLYPTATCR